MTNWPNERRESFRIDMQAYIKVALANEEKPHPEDYFTELRAISLVSELRALDNEYFLINERIKDLAAKKAIDLLQQKQDVLAKLMINQTIEEQALSAQATNISEGGCQFQCTEKFEASQKVAIALTLVPSYFTLICFADVVESNGDNNNLHLQFSGLNERQQQLLLKHMFQAQTDSKKQQGVLE